jgi:hypothetical protein
MSIDKTFSERAGEAWGSFKTGAGEFVESQNFDRFLQVLIAVGLIGAAVTVIGAVSVASQAGASLPGGEALNSLGNGAIGLMAAGGTLAIIGAICVVTLIKRMQDRANRAEEEKIKALELEGEVKTKLAQRRAREESIKTLPPWAQEEAKTLQVGYFRVIPLKSGLLEENKYAFFYADLDKIGVEQVEESTYQTTLERYRENYYE